MSNGRRAALFGARPGYAELRASVKGFANRHAALRLRAKTDFTTSYSRRQ
jgi:hypothetical protein